MNMIYFGHSLNSEWSTIALTGLSTLQGEAMGHSVTELQFKYLKRKVCSDQFIFHIRVIFTWVTQCRPTPYVQVEHTIFEGDSLKCVTKQWFPCLFLDISKALILTEIGAKRDPATLEIFSGNMLKLLSAPAHGWVSRMCTILSQGSGQINKASPTHPHTSCSMQFNASPWKETLLVLFLVYHILRVL